MDKLKIGHNIRTARREKGISCRKLGKEIKVSHSSIVRWENGENCINVLDLIRICKYLKITSKKIIGV